MAAPSWSDTDGSPIVYKGKIASHSATDTKAEKPVIRRMLRSEVLIGSAYLTTRCCLRLPNTPHQSLHKRRWRLGSSTQSQSNPVRRRRQLDGWPETRCLSWCSTWSSYSAW